MYKAFVRFTDFTAADDPNPAQANAVATIINDDDTTPLFGGASGWNADLHYSDVDDGNLVERLRNRIEDQIRSNVASETTATESQAMEIIWLD